MKRILIILLVLASPMLEAKKFYPDDPIWTDDDRRTIPQPSRIELSQVADFVENTFIKTRNKERPVARNINTLGEVPDSSWFTNRIGRNKMTIDELVRGPRKGQGPATDQPWTITDAKTQGITPGFTIKDSRGDSYFIKFDPKSHPQLATSAEVISNLFFYGFGYHVPEYYLTTLNPSNLIIAPDARIKDEDGKRRKMRFSDVEDIFKRVPRNPDGSIQAIASYRIKNALGPFKYSGRRPDDPNDIFPHEDRRELRGLRVFSAWLNHDDSRSINSLDVYADEDGRNYIKHYLIDFGSTLGSGSVKPQGRRAGNEYMIEWGPIMNAAWSFGIIDRRWRKIPYPYYEILGRYESKHFRPEAWKPEYPNPAFDRMDAADAFWATRIVAQFNDEMIRSIVKEGRLAHPEAEEYLIQTIIERRDKIIRYYFDRTNPLDNFQMNNGRLLEFENAGVRAGLASACSYRYQWFRFDNEKEVLTPIGSQEASERGSITVPEGDSPYLMVRIESHATGHPEWQKPVDVYLRNENSLSIVAIERK